MKKYWFIKNENGGLFDGLRLADTASVGYVNERLYIKAVAFKTKGRATKYIKKYLKPFTDISKLKPAAILIKESDEEKLNECMFLAIQ